MIPRRFIGALGLACGVAACAPVASRNPTPLIPREGPKAHIDATYFGGLTNRAVHAWFRVSEPAYVLVGHLGGDGRIQVLYPEMPRESGRVVPGKSIRTPHFMAQYDAVPSLYSYALTPIRTPSARLHSYDGRGHGFIFLIASWVPLRFDDISDSGLWDELEISDYRNTLDPRLLVRDFAAMVSGGLPYTLEFAESFNSTAMASYADAYQDCVTLSFLPLTVLRYTFPYSWTSSFSYAHDPCMGSGFRAFAWFPQYQNDYAWNATNRQYWNPAIPTDSTASDSTASDSATTIRRVEPRRRGQSGRTIEFAPRIDDRFGGSRADAYRFSRPDDYSPRTRERDRHYQPADRDESRAAAVRASSPRASHRPDRTAESHARPSAPAPTRSERTEAPKAAPSSSSKPSKPDKDPS